MFDSAVSFSQSMAKLTRPQNVIYPGLLSAIIGYANSKSFIVSFACYLSIFLLYSIAAGYNNLTDIRTDRLNNRKDNPLVNGSISKLSLYSFFSVNLVLLILLQFVTNQPYSFLICSIYLMLLIAYSNKRINIKSKGFLSIILLSICYGSLPYLLGEAQGSLVSINIIFVCFFQALLVFPVILAKDYKDIKGDKLTQKITPLVKYGYSTVIRTTIAISFFVVAIFLAFEKTLPFYVLLIALFIYIALVITLHRKRGVVNHYLRLLLTTSMLVISVSFAL